MAFLSSSVPPNAQSPIQHLGSIITYSVYGTLIQTLIQTLTQTPTQTLKHTPRPRNAGLRLPHRLGEELLRSCPCVQDHVSFCPKPQGDAPKEAADISDDVSK